MAQLTTPHPLLTRMTRLRGRVRTLVSLFGIGVLAASAIGSMFILMLADYLLHFSNGLRFALLLCWIIALGVMAWRYLIAPLSTRLTDRFLATRVESAHGNLSDELISAVAFIHSGATQTNAFAARHVDAAEARTASMRFEDALDFKHPARALALAALISVLVAAVAAFNAPLAGIALSRWFSASPQAWPRITHASFDWSAFGTGGKAPAAWPIGDPITLRVRVDKGGYASQRAWLYTWTDGKRAAPDLMAIQPGQSTANTFVYESELQPVGQHTLEVKLWVGDDTEQDPVRIRLAPRPEVQQLTAAITPPAYVRNPTDSTKPASAVMTDLLTQAARAVEGSHVVLRVTASKPFQLVNGVPDVRLVDQTKDTDLPLSLERRLIEPNVAEISFAAVHTIQAKVVMHDSDTFESRVDGSATIEVVPDNLPSVIITNPRRTVERTPNGFVELTDEATDDLGLSGHHLRADKFDAKPEDPAAFQADLEWSDLTTDPASGNTTGKAAYTWELGPMNLQPQARFNFYTAVQDNYDVDSKRHPWVKSAPLILQIRTEAEIMESQRKLLNEAKERLKALRNQQAETQAQTEALMKTIQASGVTTPQQKAQLGDLAGMEAQEAATATSIQQRLENVSDDLRQSRLGDSDLGKLSTDAAAGMKDVSSNDMPKAASELNNARATAGNSQANDDAAKKQAQQTADSANAADKQQDEALAKIDDVIKSLGAAGDYEAARNIVQKIFDDQAKVNQQTRQLADKTAGKQVQNLPKDIKDQMDRLAADQQSLSNRTTEVMEQMTKAAQQLQSSDPATAEALQKSVDAGKTGEVAPSQSSASDSISQNKTSDAGSSQSLAQRGLQQMLDELDKRSRLQLEELSRQLAALIEQVKKILDAEIAINKDTVVAGDKAVAAVYTKLGDRQGSNQSNAIVAQKKAENTPKAQLAAVDIRDAAEQMGLAAGPLYNAKQPPAIPPEEKSISLLQDALKKLQALKDQTDAQLKDKALADFIKQYESIRGDQTTIKTASDAVETRRLAAADHQIDRRGSVDLGIQAKTQDNLLQQIASLTADDQLSKYEVVTWMNGLVTEAMTTSRDDLKKAATGKQLATAQQTSIDRLTDIIDALKDEQKRNNEFKSGGGGGGGGGKPPLVPPLAELKLLKAMQLVVNTQTTQVDKDLQAAAAADKPDLAKQAASLAKRQGEIRKIAEHIAEKLQ